ncbi:MAG: hypothetical protein OES79_16520 [Planctomycetota bacterium]|nr:hypothetical protein [Planctomycetota bacterium]
MTASISSKRVRFPVLVVDAHERMAVAAIRSLGRAGYPVHAGSARRYAMGWGSRYTKCVARCPRYESPHFVPWLREYCHAHLIRCIVPTDDLLLAIRHAYEEFEPLLPLIDDKKAVYAGLSKFDLFSKLSCNSGECRAATNLAPFLLVRRDCSLPNIDDIESLGAPFYVKADAVASVSGTSSVVRVVQTSHEALDLTAKSLDEYDKIVIQGHVPGDGVGAFLLRWNGRVRARFMHRRLHEIPGSGWSSLRTSWWHDAIMADAENKLGSIQWEGVAMLEYRWNPETDEFWLLEMNSRFWGSLHLALYAGVDFPRLLLDAFHGLGRETVDGRESNVSCRNFALECRYVQSRLRTNGTSVAKKLGLLLEFLLLSLDPRIKSDLWFPGDRRVWWLQFRQYLVAGPN